MRACDPCGELERRPLLTRAAERNEHGTVPVEVEIRTRCKRNVARCCHQQRLLRLRGEGPADKQHGLLFGRQAQKIFAWRIRREAGRASIHSAGNELLA